LRLRPFPGAAAVALATGLVPFELDRLGDPAGCLQERQPHLAEHVAAFPGSRLPLPRPAEDAPAEQVAEGLEDVRDVVEVVPAAALDAGVAKTVVAAAEVLVSPGFLSGWNRIASLR
jgi:hypothetical protein